MKFIYVLFIVILLFSGCSEPQFINGELIEPYGILNTETKRDDIIYKIHPGTIITSIVFSETIVVPIIGVGWQLWEPVRAKNPKVIKHYHPNDLKYTRPEFKFKTDAELGTLKYNPRHVK